VPSFGQQGRVTESAGELLGIAAGTVVSYRAGDQPNNAFSLNVMNPGEVAATAGTSGVVYGVTDQLNYDPLSRVNGFVHVNHTEAEKRLGILLCVNGTGILNSWMRKNLFPSMSYEEMNALASTVAAGSDGLCFFPFGNGAERILVNKDPGAQLTGLLFNHHTTAHIVRAAQEGIVFALQYGMEIMQSMGMQLKTIRAGHANMFLSDVFAAAFTNTSGCTLELYNTDGSVGAARGAGVGAGVFSSYAESFRGMRKIKEFHPQSDLQNAYGNAYAKWKDQLKKNILNG
jgi:xylulokinase